MADNNEKKYVEVINIGVEDIYIMDPEARAGNPTYASDSTCESIVDEL
jgi:hypothetical protein